MKLKRVGVRVLTFMLMLNSVSIPAVSGWAEELVATPSDLEEIRPTATAEPFVTPEATEIAKQTIGPENTTPIESMSDPEATGTPEPTETPVPLSLHGMSAEKTIYAPGEWIIWRFVCEGAESIDYEIRNHQGDAVQGGKITNNGEITFQTEICDTYMITVTATAGAICQSEISTVYVTMGPENTTTIESMSDPEATETPEPTETPVPLSLHSLTAEKSIYAPGEWIIWRFVCEGAESIDYEIRNHQGDTVQGGEITENGEITFQTEVCDTYMLTVTATAGAICQSESSKIYVTRGDLSVSMKTDMRYAVANERPLAFQATVQGGITPYSAVVQVAVNGGVVYEEIIGEQESGDISINYMPTTDGVHTTSIVVTDGTGMESEACADLQVAIREAETMEDWESSVRGAALTGDPRSDLVAVARTQVGYQESTRNFIIDDEGNVHGYTRYGAWYGNAYGDWCAMFVSFCMNYASIPESVFPRSAHCGEWMSTLSSKGIYVSAADGYVPRQGDMIFFNWSGRSRPDHVGIVESVSGDSIQVIMGNAGKSVLRKGYSLNASTIIGYGSMETAMRNAGLLAKEARNTEIMLEASWEGETLGVGDTVTLTALDTKGYDLIWQYMDESGAWKVAQEGGGSLVIDVTRENCGWSWRAVYTDSMAEMEDAAQ